MNSQATRENIESVNASLLERGYAATSCSGKDSVTLITEGVGDAHLIAALEGAPGVDRVVVVPGKQRLTSRVFSPADTHVRIGSTGGTVIGGPEFLVIAGPCAVESRTQMNAAVDTVVAHGAGMLRGGAFKPRTSPYGFQGLGLAGLALLAEQRERTGLPVVTEVVTPQDVESVAEESDMLQIGTRNMQNFALLREVGLSGRPVLLKRGMAATIEEWMLAAEYVMHVGNADVVLCERGVRTYEQGTRFTLDLSAVAEAKRISHLPVIVDPSHSTGKPHLVGPMSRAAAACGADGLIIDVHMDSANALCDGAQALSGQQFATLMSGLGPVVEAVGRTLASARPHTLTPA
ncbi:3-deoxy-7-phosphoheptulonate synthase [Streptomyces sp. NPDC005790]|uniref:3-deoxy-7-phosphoheptulonate synthase n=1 Tax=Streptomyces sp. NPDC005790 TaxID=3154777 RepID=UPI0033EACB65